MSANFNIHREPPAFHAPRALASQEPSASPSLRPPRAPHSRCGQGTLRACAGFTLVEMLCAVIVVVLLSGLLATGVKLAVDSYSKEVSHSESKVLCSTLRTLASDELRYAGTVDASGQQIVFFSQNYGEGVGFSQNDDGQVLLGGNKILSEKAYSYGMKASISLRSYDESTRVFRVNVQVTDTSDNVLSTSDFEVQRLNE